MSKTPRTDNEFYKIGRNEWVVDADFARELELENAELRKSHREIYLALNTGEADHTKWPKQIEELRKENKLLTHKVITCGIIASHPDAELGSRGLHVTDWNSQQADEVRSLRRQRDALRAVLERRHAEQSYPMPDYVRDALKAKGGAL
jgi:hypothetical protein